MKIVIHEDDDRVEALAHGQAGSAPKSARQSCFPVGVL